MNVTAFTEGLAAYRHDCENGGLSYSPYPLYTDASDAWYRGYRFESEAIKAKEAAKKETETP